MDSKKLWITLLAVVIFMVVSLPWTYQLTNKLLGSLVQTSNAEGCPTWWGYALHTVVFALLVYGSMFVPWEELKW
jgi:TRAP-type C4-dicarboxylate transport system permease small subunit